MSEQTETLWQIGKPGDRAAEFVKSGGWQTDYTYTIGVDADPINKPNIPGVLVVPGAESKPMYQGQPRFSTERLNIAFSLGRDYGAGELTLFYDFLGSETDTVYLDGMPVAELAGVGEGRVSQHQISLPDVRAGEHEMSITTAGGTGAHLIDYLKLDGAIAPQDIRPPKPPKTEQPTAMSTMQKTASQLDMEAPADQKSAIPSSMTGLQDYSFWWSYARANATKAATDKDPDTFRRGRIWA